MLISAQYRALNRALHEARPDYGAYGHEVAKAVARAAEMLDCASVLDYGCGKGTLAGAVPKGLPVFNYDPAVPGFDAPPDPADLVAALDVIEHIEPDCLDAVLDDIQRLAIKGIVATIATIPAKKFLADGRNAHLIVQPFEWWLKQIESRWAVVYRQVRPVDFLVVAKVH